MKHTGLPEEFVVSLLAQDNLLGSEPFEEHRRTLRLRLADTTRREKRARVIMLIVCSVCLGLFLALYVGAMREMSASNQWPDWLRTAAALATILSPLAGLLFFLIYFLRYRMGLSRARKEARDEALLALPRQMEAMRREVAELRRQLPPPPGEAAARSPAAFTLVEMLVVTAIITLLAGLLLPALASAKSRARIIQCKDHLRELGHALLLYEGDFQRFPGAGDTAIPTNTVPWFLSSPQSWTVKLAPYLAGSAAVFECPDFRPADPSDRWSLGCFGYNAGGSAPMNDRAWDIGLGYGRDRFVKSGDVISPSQMIALGDLRLPPGLLWDVITPANQVPIGGLNSLVPDRHNGGAIMVFVDAHVEWGRQIHWIARTGDSRALWNRDHQPHPETW